LSSTTRTQFPTNREEPCVDQGGGIGVAELVRGDVAESGRLASTGQFGPECVLSQPVAVVGEEKMRGPSGPWVWDGPARRAGDADPVQHLQCIIIKGDHPLGGEFAQRDLESGPLAGNLVHAVHFKVQQFPDPHSMRLLDRNFRTQYSFVEERAQHK
jgi:hypothetical protein